jgi:hypothetical protein
MSPAIVALEEYGVPVQLAERLALQLGNPTSLAAALDALRSRTPDGFSGLTAFEKDFIRPLCRSHA